MSRKKPCSTRAPKRLSRYEADVLRTVKNNHIWLNAFLCIRPTEEFKRQLGAEVLRLLDQEENLIVSDFDGTPFEDLKQKELVLRINKS